MVLHLGEGLKGDVVKRRYEISALKAGYSNISEWARALLNKAAEVNEELTIEERVKRLEELVLNTN